MLAHLSEQGMVDYVIVHKVDRLARNRVDDVQIQLAIERAGARLISVTENVDDTPSGRLVRNIMADLAEFYSANLASEILKGSTQKARMGGTPHKAPLGYRNVRLTKNGREVRSVVVDEERAPFAQRAFALYATGEWSLKRLHAQLTAEGLTARPTPKRGAAPLSLSKFALMLRNRYYGTSVSSAIVASSTQDAINRWSHATCSTRSSASWTNAIRPPSSSVGTRTICAAC